jgi:hypothetical protein
MICPLFLFIKEEGSFEQEESGGRALSSNKLEQELSTANLPQPLQSMAGDGCG